MTDTPQVERARAEADESLQRIIALAQELQQRLAPRVLARDAWESAKSKGADLAEEAVDAVRNRPVAAAGAVAAITAFLAREPLMDLVGKLWNGKDEKKKPAKRAPRKKTKEPKGSDKKTEATQ